MHSLMKPLLLATLFSLSSVGAVLAQNAYITNYGSNNVSVIDTATNTVIATINMSYPFGVAVTPDGNKVYVTNPTAGGVPNLVSVIDTGTNTVIGTITVGANPFGVAVTPDGTKVYVANLYSASVSVINTATNTVSSTIPISSIFNPIGVAVSPDGSRVFVTGNPGVVMIDTETNTVLGTIPCPRIAWV